MKKLQIVILIILFYHPVTAFGTSTFEELLSDSKNIIMFREVEVLKRPTMQADCLEVWKRDDVSQRAYGLRLKTVSVQKSSTSGVSFLSGITGFSFGSTETKEEQITFLNEDEIYLLLLQIDKALKFRDEAKSKNDKTVARLPINENVNLVIRLTGPNFASGIFTSKMGYDFGHDYELNTFGKNLKNSLAQLKASNPNR